MNSISTSNILAEIENLSLSYNLSFYQNDSLREVFIGMMKNPLSFYFRKFSQHLVLDNISFTIANGDRIGILGVNGAGKTSLCRVLAGMYQPSKGSVKTFGETRAIFDTSVGILEDLTGRENARLLIELMYPTLNSQEKEEILIDCLNFSELGKFLDIPFKKYSKGMQSRLCLSLISARATDLLILDEVFDGADEFFREKISKRVIEMINASGSVIFVSHTPDQIMQTCNRLIVLDQKKIVYDGDVNNGISFYKGLHQ